MDPVAAFLAARPYYAPAHVAEIADAPVYAGPFADEPGHTLVTVTTEEI